MTKIYIEKLLMDFRNKNILDLDVKQYYSLLKYKSYMLAKTYKPEIYEEKRRMIAIYGVPEYANISSDLLL